MDADRARGARLGGGVTEREGDRPRVVGLRRGALSRDRDRDCDTESRELRAPGVRRGGVRERESVLYDE